MGKQNRQRRRERRRNGGPDSRQQRPERPVVGPGPDWDAGLEVGTVDRMVARAAEAVHRDWAQADAMLATLVAGPPVPGGRQLVARRLTVALTGQLTAVWERGWQPSELHRLTRRRIGSRAAAAVAAAIKDESRRCARSATDPAWARQVASVDAGRWTLDPDGPSWAGDVAVVLAAVGLVAHLAPLPRLEAPASHDPRMEASAHNQRILEKVRALLAKAESTGFPEEAEAFTSKAQELLARHNIDRAAVAASASPGPPQASVRRVWIDEPYVNAKSLLLQVVAGANRCRAVRCDGRGFSTVAGHDDDLDTVELLFTSLLVQATTRMTAAGARRDQWGRSRTRAFRQSFLVAYAHRIGARLRAAAETATTAAAEEHGHDLLPVLAGRRSAADQAIDAMFGRLAPARVTAGDHAGWVAGTAAADLASLTVARRLTGPSGV